MAGWVQTPLGPERNHTGSGPCRGRRERGGAAAAAGAGDVAAAGRHAAAARHGRGGPGPVLGGPRVGSGRRGPGVGRRRVVGETARVSRIIDTPHYCFGQMQRETG